MSDEQMTIKRSTYKTIVASVVVLAIAFSFSAGFLIGSNTTRGTSQIVAAAPSPQAPSQPDNNQPQQPSVVQVSLDDDPVLGDPNAKITIVEFSDIQCPFCGRFFDQTLPSLKKDYIDTGKVKLVFRDFPLSFHQNAQKAAETAECADEQGKFWEMHDTLFQNQDSWANLDDAGAATAFKGYAKTLGLSSAFDSCLDTGKTASEVQKDFSDGSSYGVSGTPTFYVNGVELVGAQPYSVFKQLIDQQLAS